MLRSLSGGCSFIAENIKESENKQFYLRVACSLEYENLKKFYLKSVLASKKTTTGRSEKNEGNLKINLEKVNLKKVVGNLI